MPATQNNFSSILSLGKIQIITEKSVTVRSSYDIDTSRTIGQLDFNDTRYFVGKKWLPPPSPDEDDDDDDECIGVMRYKVCLDKYDLSLAISIEEDDDNDILENLETKSKTTTYGWISDRGRLAYDPYRILKEVADTSFAASFDYSD